MDDPRYEPERVETSAQQGIRITWADGHVSAYELADLRRACGCAVCNELRRAGQPVFAGSDDELDVIDAGLVGSYGVTFHWSDGHQTGVYGWDDLRNGCPCDECRSDRRMQGRRNPLDR